MLLRPVGLPASPGGRGILETTVERCLVWQGAHQRKRPSRRTAFSVSAPAV